MCKIIGISGKKQSGKNTSANYLHGLVLKKERLTEDFTIDGKTGELLVLTDSGWGVFDVTRKDSSFVEYAEVNMWPYVKLYSFADTLKELCVDLFDLKGEQVYGTDEQKNTPTDILWNDVPGTRKKGNMTAREFMQYFGTNVCRKIKSNVWVDHMMKTIKQEKTNLAIIADVRFPNEVEAIREAGGKVVRLARSNHKDSHPSECGLDPENFDWSGFDLVIENHGAQTETLEAIDKMYRSLILTGELC